MKILVVDDNEVNLHLLVAMLGRNNYEVIKANNGYDAIKVFEQHQPDLVLMDIMMPGMDGRECASRLKQIAGDVYVPIIYVTALSQEAALSTALAAGGDDFVSKPINFDILLSKIKAHGRIQELNSELSQKNCQLADYNLRLERDQELAAHFFDKALKHSYLDPAIIRHHLSAASAFNGDLLMAAPRPGGGIYVILGDFTGHGLGASIGSLPVAQIFFNLTRQGAWIGDIARELNRELRNLLPDDMFLAATLVELNSTGTRLSVWAGGLPDAYLIDSQNHAHRIIRSSYPPLGILDDDNFNPATDSYAVNQGEHLYLYTDGIIETKNALGEEYGIERLHKLFLQHETGVFEQIIDSIRLFLGHEHQTDDTSFVELVCQPIAEKTDDKVKPPDSDANDVLLPYRLSIELSDDQLKNETDIVSQLSSMICASTLAAHKGTIHTILAEIYTNMLEHGLLHLSSKQKSNNDGFDAYYAHKQQALAQATGLLMRLDITLQPDSDSPRSRLVICASHNAESTQAVAVDPNQDPTTKPSGRGMLLLESLCERVVLEDKGQRVTVTYLA